ncbi:MAG TPA: hypothetical protein VMW24_06510 [Sedimentisphaerales bacterium]|nr:hypothetical protein [Sedimentisphaerales bacterium]
MSRTNHKQRAERRGAGKEYWASRLQRGGEESGRYTKLLTHRLERRRASMEIQGLLAELS